MTQSEERKGPVLVVEDDLDFSEFLSATLADHGYATEVVMDGDKALERALELRPRGITLDLLLPGRTGISIYRNLRRSEETRDIPVVIITGVGTFGKRLEVERFFRGRNIPPPEGVLQKPIEPEALIEALKAALGPGTPKESEETAIR